ncbi:hypothetical protein GCM10027589_51340 [Actinocorallia lasiicapitis]
MLGTDLGQSCSFGRACVWLFVFCSGRLVSTFSLGTDLGWSCSPGRACVRLFVFCSGRLVSTFSLGTDLGQSCSPGRACEQLLALCTGRTVGTLSFGTGLGRSCSPGRAWVRTLGLCCGRPVGAFSTGGLGQSRSFGVRCWARVWLLATWPGCPGNAFLLVAGVERARGFAFGGRGRTRLFGTRWLGLSGCSVGGLLRYGCVGEARGPVLPCRVGWLCFSGGREVGGRRWRAALRIVAPCWGCRLVSVCWQAGL